MLPMAIRNPAHGLPLLAAVVTVSQGAHAQLIEPSQGDILTADGSQIAYRVDGEGESAVVVLRDGAPGDRRDTPIDLSPLAEQRSVIYYEQRGTGQSTVASDESNLDFGRHTEDLETVRSHFGLDRIGLIGIGTGATLAAQYALRFPGRIADLLLIDAQGTAPPALDARTLLIAGARDTAQITSARRWAASFPNSRLLVIGDSDRNPFVEQPEAFFAASEAFLNGDWPDKAQFIAPLFATDDVIDVTLNAPIRTLVNRRARRPEVDGTLSYAGANDAAVQLYAEVTTRGMSRLEICRFPPLRLNLRRGEVGGTLFARQNRIKLATRCMDDERYEQYMLLEYLIYRIYEEVTDFAYDVRLVNVNYVDSERDDRSEIAPAFFIEHIDGLAERVGLRAIEQEEPVPRQSLDSEQLAVYTVFQYMIGNTDWSVLRATDGRECCHNTDLLGPLDGDGPLIPVPYDFDQAGLIDTRYALPAEGLGIRSVTDRLYRGMCASNNYLDATIARFNAVRGRIETLFETDRLDDEYREQALDYLSRSYEIINDPELRQTEIVERCRG